ncbi:unnamed protein product [Choristocarpus tenellus]
MCSMITQVSGGALEESYEASKGQIPQEMVVHRVISPSSKREGAYESDDRLERIDIFLPIGPKDSLFAPFLFRSLELFTPCYGDLVVLIEPQSISMLFSVIPLYAYVFVVGEPLPPQFGYLTQQFLKMYADVFTSNDYVLILETDLVQSSSAVREGYFDEQGKIMSNCRMFGDVKWCGENCDIWKVGTEHALGVPMDRDCLMKSPFLYPREIFGRVRNHIENHLGKPLIHIMEDYFAGHSKGWEVTDTLFSELNILNMYGRLYMPEEFNFITIDRHGIDSHICFRHVGSQVRRNYDIWNPKATEQYFELAQKYVYEEACRRDPTSRGCG